MNEKLIIRLSRVALDFTVINTANVEEPITFMPYDVKPGISMAANLREAFRNLPLLSATYQRIMVMIDSPVLMVPVNLYDEKEQETLYYHSFPSSSPDSHHSPLTTHHSPLTILASVVPDLSCVALYAVNRDLKTVIDDHFPQAQYLCAQVPVWRQLHQRSFTGVRSKLYGYFHDQRLDVFSFHQNRFKFCNSFVASRRADSLYFLLYVWHQLHLQQEHDELHLVGNIPERDALLDDLRQYLRRAYVISPSADYNRSPATQIEGMPYDLMTYIVKGR